MAINAVKKMRLEILKPLECFDLTRQIWTGLSVSSKAPYFLSWAWVENWLSSLPDTIQVKLFVFSDESSPIAGFFLREKKAVRKKLFYSRGIFLNTTGLAPYDNLCIEYNRILFSDGGKYSFWDMVDLLPMEWDEFFLPALDARFMTARRLDHPPEKYHLIIEKKVPSPYVDLESVRQSKEGYISLLGKNTRAQIRRSYREYEQKGVVAFECAATLGMAIDIYRELVGLHQQSWQSKGLPGAFATEYFKGFHQELIRKRFDAGEIQLLRISAGNETIGCLYNFVYNDKVLFYQSGIRYCENKKIKPGLLCHFEAINYNASLSRSVYDFLGGESQYKLNLSTHRNDLIWVIVQKKHPRFFIENKLKGMKQSFAKRK